MYLQVILKEFDKSGAALDTLCGLYNFINDHTIYNAEALDEAIGLFNIHMDKYTLETLGAEDTLGSYRGLAKSIQDISNTTVRIIDK